MNAQEKGNHRIIELFLKRSSLPGHHLNTIHHFKGRCLEHAYMRAQLLNKV